MTVYVKKNQNSLKGPFKLLTKAGMNDLKKGMKLFGEHVESGSVNVKSAVENLGAVWLTTVKMCLLAFVMMLAMAFLLFSSWLEYRYKIPVGQGLVGVLAYSVLAYTLYKLFMFM